MVTDTQDLQPSIANHTKIYCKGLTPGKINSEENQKYIAKARRRNVELKNFLLGTA
jgi:hypothetical protein